MLLVPTGTQNTFRKATGNNIEVCKVKSPKDLSLPHRLFLTFTVPGPADGRCYIGDSYSNEGSWCSMYGWTKWVAYKQFDGFPDDLLFLCPVQCYVVEIQKKCRESHIGAVVFK